jgi:hypothetical protein
VDNFGYGGFSAADFLNGNGGVFPMNDVAAADPSDIFLCLGSNANVGASLADILTIWDTWTGQGRRVFGSEVLPRASSASGYTSEKLAETYALNAALKLAASERGIPFLEWASVIAEEPGGFGNLSYIPDGVHPGILGADVLGEAWANFMAPYCGDPYQPPADASAEWVTANPYMAGDVSGGATGWTFNGAGHASKSKITDPDGTVWQRIGVSGASTTSALLRQTSGAGSWAVGDVVRPVARIRGVESGWSITNIRLVGVKIGTPNVVGTSGDQQTTSLDGVRLPMTGTLYGAEYTIPADATGMHCYLYASGTGSFDVTACGLVKVG